jgi:hypothetical protein
LTLEGDFNISSDFVNINGITITQEQFQTLQNISTSSSIQNQLDSKLAITAYPLQGASTTSTLQTQLDGKPNLTATTVENVFTGSTTHQILKIANDGYIDVDNGASIIGSENAPAFNNVIDLLSGSLHLGQGLIKTRTDGYNYTWAECSNSIGHCKYVVSTGIPLIDDAFANLSGIPVLSNGVYLISGSLLLAKGGGGQYLVGQYLTVSWECVGGVVPNTTLTTLIDTQFANLKIELPTTFVVITSTSNLLTPRYKLNIQTTNSLFKISFEVSLIRIA